MGAGKQTCGELAHFHKNAGKVPAGKNYAVKVNAGNHPRTIFSTPVLIRHLWQLKTAVFVHWCLIGAVPLPYFCKLRP